MSQNQSPKITRRRALALASIVMVCVLLGALGYVNMLDSSPPLSLAATDAALYAEEQALETAPPNPTDQAAQIAAVLLPNLQQSLVQLQDHFDSTLQAQAQQHAQALQKWQLQAKDQARQLEQVSASVQTLEKRLAEVLDDQHEVAAGTEPGFRFRGIEVWHGRVYALLEYQGQILTASAGDSRLGWRIHDIDREQRQLRVSNGTHEHVLEES